MPIRLLIAGASTRAAAHSAGCAGYDVVAWDAFADRDQHPRVEAHACAVHGGQPMAAALAHAARDVRADAVVYLSPFENDPPAVEVLTGGRQLFGNHADTLRRVRDPLLLHRTLEQHRVPAPHVCPAGVTPPAGPWLLKPFASGGGRGVRTWRPGVPVPADHYLQQQVEGVPGSVTLIAAKGECAIIGVSRQLIGDDAFGAAGFRYCGSIDASAGDAFEETPQLMAAATALARTVAAAFDLRGLNGIDFVARGGLPLPVEVNPRWSSSMELFDRDGSASLMAAHADACTTRRITWRGAPAGAVTGKAIVFARRTVVMGDTSGWLATRARRDVPWPGQQIARGEPICTVYARASSYASCYAALVEQASAVYRELADSSRRLRSL